MPEKTFSVAIVRTLVSCVDAAVPVMAVMSVVFVLFAWLVAVGFVGVGSVCAG